MDSQELYCATCATVAPFERCRAFPPPATPPIDDDRDGGSEWACTRCGEAILLAPLTPVAASSNRRRRRRMLPRQRPAAA